MLIMKENNQSKQALDDMQKLQDELEKEVHMRGSQIEDLRDQATFVENDSFFERIL